MTTRLDPHARFVPKVGVHARRFDDEAVLLDLSSGAYYGLNEVGARIWEALARGRSVEEVTVEILDAYDVDGATLRGDVERITLDLLARGLLSVEGAAP